MTNQPLASEILRRFNLVARSAALPTPIGLSQVRAKVRPGDVRLLKGRGLDGSSLIVVVLHVHASHVADVVPARLGHEDSTSVDLIVSSGASTVGESITVWPAIVGTVFTPDLERKGAWLIGRISRSALSTISAASELGCNPREVDLAPGLLLGPLAVNPTWLLRLRQSVTDALSAVSYVPEIGEQSFDVLTTAHPSVLAVAPREARICAGDINQAPESLRGQLLRQYNRRIGWEFPQSARELFDMSDLPNAAAQLLARRTQVWGPASGAPHQLTVEIGEKTLTYIPVPERAGSGR